ncbi:MAG: sodium:calcium antiporter [Candidatus Bathyarchaeota archaeon]
MNVKYTVSVLAFGLALYLLGPETLPFSVLGMIIGLVIVIIIGEPMVEGLQEFSEYTGLSSHVTGILSSLTSNLPEMIMTMFMIFSPQLKEVAILSVLLASTFNGLLLGVLVIMLTWKGGSIEIPKKALENDVEVMRLAIGFSIIVFGTGIILTLNSEVGPPLLPWEIPVFMLLAYIGYLFFVARGGKGGHEGHQPHLHEGEKSKAFITPIALGLIGTVIAAELIASSSEFFVHVLHLNVVFAATLIGFAGSVPEHGMALIGARGGHVELGVSNLLSGVVQSILLIFPIVALLVPVYLDGYVLYQFLAIAVTLWILLKSIVDDGKLTLDEGVSIIVIYLLGILLFDQLSLIF